MRKSLNGGVLPSRAASGSGAVGKVVPNGAPLQPRSRSGYAPGKFLTAKEVERLGELAYRSARWLDYDGEETPEEFAESVLGQFEALLADHAELAGYGFRREGFGRTVADHAETVPKLWRPGTRWPRRAGD